MKFDKASMWVSVSLLAATTAHAGGAFSFRPLEDDVVAMQQTTSAAAMNPGQQSVSFRSLESQPLLHSKPEVKGGGATNRQGYRFAPRDDSGKIIANQGKQAVDTAFVYKGYRFRPEGDEAAASVQRQTERRDAQFRPYIHVPDNSPPGPSFRPQQSASDRKAVAAGKLDHGKSKQPDTKGVYDPNERMIMQGYGMPGGYGDPFVAGVPLDDMPSTRQIRKRAVKQMTSDAAGLLPYGLHQDPSDPALDVPGYTPAYPYPNNYYGGANPYAGYGLPGTQNLPLPIW